MSEKMCVLCFMKAALPNSQILRLCGEFNKTANDSTYGIKFLGSLNCPDELPSCIVFTAGRYSILMQITVNTAELR